jgi:sulfatase maturation enzyme AslB (radical SAM superfamily)
MSFETAKKIIDDEVLRLEGYDEILFELFGGEPFMNFGLVKEIVSYVRTLKFDIPMGVFITTNGTLIHEEVKEWAIANHDLVRLGLSYDGTCQMQDMNRSGSSKFIDLDFFKEYYPHQVIKMTVSKDTLPFLYEGVVFLHDKGFEVACNLAYATNWQDNSCLRILEQELIKLINYYIENPDVKPCELLNQTVMGVASAATMNKRSCGAGIESNTYDVDGQKYPCQLFVPMSCGYEKAKKAQSIHFYDNEIPEELCDSKCLLCVAKGACNSCYGSNYLSTGNMYVADNSWCTLQKVVIKARAYFQAKLWKLGRLTLTEQEEMALLQSIALINERLV